MTSADLTDDLLPTEAPTPALTLLAAAIDREFTRREPRTSTIYQYAAEQLGVAVSDLATSTRAIDTQLAHSVGRWLYDTQRRLGAALVGSRTTWPATTTSVPAPDGAVRAFSSATVVLPAGVLHPSSCVLRIVSERFGVEVELIGRWGDADELAATLDDFLATRRATDSPYRHGAYRVTSNNRGLVLKRWSAPTVGRDLLKLDPGVWLTIDRKVHRVLELADDLTARGLGTSAGVLLVGPPGTGKTQLGTVVARELRGTATVLVPGSRVIEDWLIELFDLAVDLAPCLILMDDLDLIAGERGTTSPQRLREFLNVMDGGLAERSGVVVIASTNDHRKVDKAAQRSSRFDTVITMEAPAYDGRLAILQRYLAWCTADLDLPAVARATDGATGADLKELVRAAVLDTSDEVTTQALLAQAASGRWRAGGRAVGDYL